MSDRSGCCSDLDFIATCKRWVSKAGFQHSLKLLKKRKKRAIVAGKISVKKGIDKHAGYH